MVDDKYLVESLQPTINICDAAIKNANEAKEVEHRNYITLTTTTLFARWKALMSSMDSKSFASYTQPKITPKDTNKITTITC